MRTTKTRYLFWRARRWGPCASNTTRSEKKRTSVTVCCFYRLERLKGARLVVPRCASLLHLQAWAAILLFAWYVFCVQQVSRGVAVVHWCANRAFAVEWSVAKVCIPGLVPRR